MKYHHLFPWYCLLALMLGACAWQGNLTNGTSQSDPGNPQRKTQSSADQRGSSGTSAKRNQAPVDYGGELTADVSDLEGLISDLNARITKREIIVELPADVLFDFNQAEIRSDAVPTLKKLGKLIKQSGDGAIQVNGHTDSIGSDLYNTTLSERRAAAVVGWLITSEGIGAERLRAKGFGESRPVAMNTNPDGSDNPEGRQKNRRVEVVIPRKIKS